MATNWCSNCGSEPARARGWCVNCYHYRRRTGRDRPEAAIVAENIRKHEADVERKLIREAVLRAERAEERRRERER